jgi:alkylation response protein AidB-like acyl-CoA dehydrogenase
MFSAAPRAAVRAARALPRVLARPTAIATPTPGRFYSTEEDGSLPQIASLNTFTDEESAMREMVSKFASEVIAPRVKAMDEAEVMDPEVIKALFENGLMGIEVEEEFGGAGASFVSSLIAVEEISRVDPTVSIVVVSSSRALRGEVLSSDFVGTRAAERITLSTEGRVRSEATASAARESS